MKTMHKINSKDRVSISLPFGHWLWRQLILRSRSNFTALAVPHWPLVAEAAFVAAPGSVPENRSSRWCPKSSLRPVQGLGI